MSKPSAKLISNTEFPLGTLVFVWQQSRSDNVPMLPEDFERSIKMTKDFPSHAVGSEALEIVKQLIYEDVPVTECIHFTFFLQNIPVSLREQLVRHRIGVSVGPLQGLDQIPELGSSTFWSQTSRMVSQSDFYDFDKFITPESCDNVKGGKVEEWREYDYALRDAQRHYNALLDLGVPMEDARQVLPLAATQSMTWTLSLKALMHIIGKRACQIAQYNLWQPIITDMINELCDKVHPLFRGIVSPPCISKGKYVGCPVEMVNCDRDQGREEYPACSIWGHYRFNGQYDGGPNKAKLPEVMRKFEETWKLSARTGLPLAEENTQK